MNRTVEIIVDMNKKCFECGRKGATQSGICLDCLSKDIAMRIKTRADFKRRAKTGERREHAS